MRILGINSSPRGGKSQTLRLVQAVLKGAQDKGAAVELIDLCKLKIKYCQACDVCHRSGPCVHKDDLAGLRVKLMAAQGVVLGSPDYFRTVTAQMKTWIDRMADVIHCQLMAGKYGCSVATAGGPAGDEVTTYLNETLVAFGACVVGGVTASVGRGPQAVDEAEQRAFKLGQELAEAIETQRVYPEQREKHKAMAGYFKQLVERNKDRWPYEAELWAKMGA
jgi:multimeric flavodoxin WrbA